MLLIIVELHYSGSFGHSCFLGLLPIEINAYFSMCLVSPKRIYVFTCQSYMLHYFYVL